MFCLRLSSCIYLWYSINAITFYCFCYLLMRLVIRCKAPHLNNLFIRVRIRHSNPLIAKSNFLNYYLHFLWPVRSHPPYQIYSKSIFVAIGETSTAIFRCYLNPAVYYPTSDPLPNFRPSWVIRFNNNSWRYHRAAIYTIRLCCFC